eukprot:TRINITY_DN671_c0_g1_i3.p1 TRINITY_DN671_c0_g1~~TRINITY_DN671_c0_g1_i3.p1  ORF type:complete len:273 (-),score=34.63 TRINITY_DN671_c0_g1_i3:117-935(-)
MADKRQDEWTIEVNQVFHIGSLTHYNYAVYLPICGSTVFGLTLNVTDVNNSSTQLSYTFPLLIDETFNEPPCPYPSVKPCSDRILWNSVFSDLKFSFNGTDYTLRMKGFSTRIGGTVISQYISEEFQTNIAFLFASIIEVDKVCTSQQTNYLCGVDEECQTGCTTCGCVPVVPSKSPSKSLVPGGNEHESSSSTNVGVIVGATVGSVGGAILLTALIVGAILLFIWWKNYSNFANKVDVMRNHKDHVDPITESPIYTNTGGSQSGQIFEDQL